MFRTTTARFFQQSARRAYTTSDSTEKAAHKLAEQALAQKTATRTKATIPKGDKKPSKSAEEKSTHWKAYALSGGFAVGSALGGLFYFGRPFEDGREDKYVEENPLMAAYHRCVDRYTEFTEKMHEPMWDKLLPDPLPEPYNRPYTLVINLDDTLVHSTWDSKHGWRHAKRPGVDYFLAYMSQFFEIVIFTSQQSYNAEGIINSLDPYQYSMYRLYRESTRYMDGKFVKDLSHLNRDLSKVIIMDSNPDAFCLQPENGIRLRPFTGDPKDLGLLEHIPFLEAVAIYNVPDVRPVIGQFGGEDVPAKFAKWEEAMKEQHRLQWEAEQKEKPKLRNLGSILGSGSASAAAGQHPQDHQQQGPPPTPLDMARQQYRRAFAEEHMQARAQHEEAIKKDMEAQKAKLKEMKMTVWELMAQASTVRFCSMEKIKDLF
ncbi:HAD-like domain-containing protein [Dichotomocladium elegans]|nr:HAD-like domain-containing protein [Dichotomocladium elegans]